MEKTGLIELTQIDGVKNIFIGNNSLDLVNGLNYLTMQEIEKFKHLTEQRLKIADLELNLRKTFGSGEIIMTGENIRFATCIGWKNTQLHRKASRIIIPGTQMEYNSEIQNNIGNNIIDPIGWASRAAAPNNYGLLGKIAAFRGTEGNKEFNQELYNELFSTVVEVGEILGYAVEINDSETAIMPVVEIKGGEDIIGLFNEQKFESDIQTAKHYGLNGKN